MRFTEITLGELSSMKYGKMPKKDILLDSDEGFPVYSGYRVTGYAKEFLYQDPMLIVVARGVGGTGDVKISPPQSWITNLSIVLNVDDEIVDKVYLRYKLNRENLKEKLNTGAAQAQITIDNLSSYSIKLPPIDVQRRIASTLSAYDDLIENNRHRIQLLEQAARLLYKEWFVHFRFPGHEHVKIIDGVPEGWERKTLAELCESIDYGYTASAEKEEIGPKFLRITDIVPDIIDWSTVPHCSIKEEKLEKFRLREGDIVIARTGATVGYAKRLHKRHPHVVFASYLVRLRLKPGVDNLMVGIFVESDIYKSYVQSCIGGAAQPNANAKVLAGAEILVSPPHLQRSFHEFVEPLIDQREVLQVQNQKLQAARDLLLPRLMNGEIAV